MPPPPKGFPKEFPKLIAAELIQFPKLIAELVELIAESVELIAAPPGINCTICPAEFRLLSELLPAPPRPEFPAHFNPN